MPATTLPPGAAATAPPAPAVAVAAATAAAAAAADIGDGRGAVVWAAAAPREFCSGRVSSSEGGAGAGGGGVRVARVAPHTPPQWKDVRGAPRAPRVIAASPDHAFVGDDRGQTHVFTHMDSHDHDPIRVAVASLLPPDAPMRGRRPRGPWAHHRQQQQQQQHHHHHHQIQGADEPEGNGDLRHVLRGEEDEVDTLGPAHLRLDRGPPAPAAAPEPETETEAAAPVTALAVARKNALYVATADGALAYYIVPPLHGAGPIVRDQQPERAAAPAVLRPAAMLAERARRGDWRRPSATAVAHFQCLAVDEHYLYAGATNGLIHLWSLTTNTFQTELAFTSQPATCLLRAGPTTLWAGFYDGSVLVLDVFGDKEQGVQVVAQARPHTHPVSVLLHVSAAEVWSVADGDGVPPFAWSLPLPSLLGPVDLSRREDVPNCLAVPSLRDSLSAGLPAASPSSLPAFPTRALVEIAREPWERVTLLAIAGADLCVETITTLAVPISPLFSPHCMRESSTDGDATEDLKESEPGIKPSAPSALGDQVQSSTYGLYEDLLDSGEESSSDRAQASLAGDRPGIPWPQIVKDLHRELAIVRAELCEYRERSEHECHRIHSLSTKDESESLLTSPIAVTSSFPSSHGLGPSRVTSALSPASPQGCSILAEAVLAKHHDKIDVALPPLTFGVECVPEEQERMLGLYRSRGDMFGRTSNSSMPQLCVNTGLCTSAEGMPPKSDGNATPVEIPHGHSEGSIAAALFASVRRAKTLVDDATSKEELVNELATAIHLLELSFHDQKPVDIQRSADVKTCVPPSMSSPSVSKSPTWSPRSIEHGTVAKRQRSAPVADDAADATQVELQLVKENLRSVKEELYLSQQLGDDATREVTKLQSERDVLVQEMHDLHVESEATVQSLQRVVDEQASRIASFGVAVDEAIRESQIESKQRADLEVELDKKLEQIHNLEEIHRNAENGLLEKIAELAMAESQVEAEKHATSNIQQRLDDERGNLRLMQEVLSSKATEILNLEKELDGARAGIVEMKKAVLETRARFEVEQEAVASTRKLLEEQVCLMSAEKIKSSKSQQALEASEAKLVELRQTVDDERSKRKAVEDLMRSEISKLDARTKSLAERAESEAVASSSELERVEAIMKTNCVELSDARLRVTQLEAELLEAVSKMKIEVDRVQGLRKDCASLLFDNDELSSEIRSLRSALEVQTAELDICRPAIENQNKLIAEMEQVLKENETRLEGLLVTIAPDHSPVSAIAGDAVLYMDNFVSKLKREVFALERGAQCREKELRELRKMVDSQDDLLSSLRRQLSDAISERDSSRRALLAQISATANVAERLAEMEESRLELENRLVFMSNGGFADPSEFRDIGSVTSNGEVITYDGSNTSIVHLAASEVQYALDAARGCMLDTQRNLSSVKELTAGLKERARAHTESLPILVELEGELRRQKALVENSPATVKAPDLEPALNVVMDVISLLYNENDKMTAFGAECNDELTKYSPTPQRARSLERVLAGWRSDESEAIDQTAIAATMGSARSSTAASRENTSQIWTPRRLLNF